MSMPWLFHRSRERKFTNREGNAAFDFSLRRANSALGVSAVVRVRNEAAKVRHCLESILPLFDEIVVADNGSDDDTAAIVADLSAGSNGLIRTVSYSHRLARFGPEHDDTPEDSLRSAAYFTSWSISHCRFRYVCKWDGDMVAVKDTKPAFAEFLSHIQEHPRKCWTLAGQTVYRAADGQFYLAKGEVNREIEIFPYGYPFRFRKKRHWEGLTRPRTAPKGDFDPVAFYELKFADEAEFDHWSTREWPSERKRREWQNFNLIKSGAIDPAAFVKLPPDFLDREVQ